MSILNSIQIKLHRQNRVTNLYQHSIFLVIFTGLLPTIVLLILSYFQSIAHAEENLKGIINRATLKTNQLLEDAATILNRSNIDLQNADIPTTIKILQRQIYNDFRFREAGIINPQGFLTLSSLGAIDPPVPSSPIKLRFNPHNPNLQILGLGKTQLMQERSVILMLRGSGKIGSIYLLVDPAVLNNFLEAIPDLDLGSNGFIAFMTSDRQLLSVIGSSTSDIADHLQETAPHSLFPQTLQVIQSTKNQQILVVGTVHRSWALRYWLQELIVSVPLTVVISSLLSYLFIRQVRYCNTLDYELKRALAQNEFEVHYQPIIDLATRRCVGAEALLRWRHPQRGLIYPGTFIPIAEQTAFIIPMTEWMIEKVLQDRALLHPQFQGLYTSVNLSPTQLNTGDVDRLLQTLRSTNQPTNARITFEITENKLLEEQGQVVQDAIARLKLWGARFAIDDFGTGYSNIGYLQRLDVDQLKLDQLFVKGLEQGNNIDPIVDSLIDFGDRIGLTIVAEGIETEAQYQYLKKRGVHYGQGWLFSRPLPFTEFERFLQNQTA